MPSFLEKLRLNNIFAPQGIPANDLPSQGGYDGTFPGTNPGIGPVRLGGLKPPPSEDISPFTIERARPPQPNVFETAEVPTPTGALPPPSSMNALEMYKPETEARDRFNTMMAAYPKYERPGLLRQIAGSLVGSVLGTDAGINVINAKHNRQLQDWKNQMGYIEKAADNERMSNTNSRTLAMQTASQQLKEEAEAAKQRKDAVASEALMLRSRALDYKARHPNAQFKEVKGGNLHVWDPDAKKMVDTGIPMGSMSEFERLEFLHEGRMEEGAQRGNFQITVADRRADAAADAAGNKGWQILEMDDPDNPGKKVPVRINVNTGEKQRIEGIGQVQKLGTSKSVQPVNLKDIQERTRETLDSINGMYDKQGNLASHIRTAVGKSRMFMTQYIPGTEGKRGDVDINNLKSKQVLDLIGELKAQSRTGATGFGALNMKELGVLEQAASKLDPALDETSFKAELDRIKEKLEKILLPEDGMTGTTTNAPPRSADKLIEHYSRPAGGK